MRALLPILLIVGGLWIFASVSESRAQVERQRREMARPNPQLANLLAERTDFREVSTPRVFMPPEMQ